MCPNSKISQNFSIVALHVFLCSTLIYVCNTSLHRSCLHWYYAYDSLLQSPSNWCLHFLIFLNVHLTKDTLFSLLASDCVWAVIRKASVISYSLKVPLLQANWVCLTWVESSSLIQHLFYSLKMIGVFQVFFSCIPRCCKLPFSLSDVNILLCMVRLIYCYSEFSTQCLPPYT